MKSLLILFFLVVISVQADEVIPLDFQGVDLRGTGCKPQNTDTAISPDNSAISVLFSDFNVEVPSLDGDNDNSSFRAINFDENLSYKMCYMTIKAKIPEGHKVKGIKVSFDYRGYTSIEEGTEAMVESKIVRVLAPTRRSFGNGKRIFKEEWKNEFIDEDFSVSASEKIMMDSSPCATKNDNSINVIVRNLLKARIRPQYHNSGAMALLMMDSADITGALKVEFTTVKCSNQGSNNGNGRGNSGSYGPNQCPRGQVFHPRLRRCYTPRYRGRR